MLKDIAGIELSGANFKRPEKLEIFDPIDGGKLKVVKGTLLYGRNGSGKSTIARGFRKIAGESLPVINQVTAFDKDGKTVHVTDDEKKRIFVFDEDYVDKNVKLHEEHLDTIVMLGEQADLTEQIRNAESERDTAKANFEKQQQICDEYHDSTNSKAPSYYIAKLRLALQGDDNWAGRDKAIRGGKQNTGVKDNTYKQFQQVVPTKSRDKLIIDFSEAEKELEAAKGGTAVISRTVPSLPVGFASYDDTEVQKLLLDKIERPQLSEREVHLLTIVQHGKSRELIERKELFEKSETTFCPYCFQKLTPEYKADLVQSIERVLSKVVEDHQRVLRERMRGEIPIDLTPFEKLEGYRDCIDLISRIDSAVWINNNLLQEKIDDPYEPIESEMLHIQELTCRLVEALSALENQRVEYNKQVKSTTPIIDKLTRINSEIAHYDTAELVKQYEKQNAECKSAERLCAELKEVYSEKEKRVKDLEAKRSNIILALEAINNSMKYIFFANDRLKIEYTDGNYKLLSHGHSVRPCEVSVGERNIIGLCYFLTSILKGQEEERVYKNEYLLIIDDPISSYDMENRVGILSFLKYKLGTFLEGNVNTKALVMTHDLMTFYDIHKIFEEIIESCKLKGYSVPPKFNGLELRNESIGQFQYKKRQEYTELIRVVYAYGQNYANEQELVIGNIMRQVLEAFATFEYKKGIEDVSTDEEILSLMEDEKYKAYFRNLMYRLVLHGGSHKEEQVKSMDDLTFFSHISDTEKKRTARDILCFIYLLNKQHLISHLKEVDRDVDKTLDSWCKDVQTRAAVI